MYTHPEWINNADKEELVDMNYVSLYLYKHKNRENST